MTITFLGHAGFFVDCGTDRILCDPWFDTKGAYAASWFPFPANDHLDLSLPDTATHLYISHWHRDHFDEWFLRSRTEAFKERVNVIIARFRYPKLEEWIRACGYTNITLVEDGAIHTTASGTEILIQTDENPLYTDSSIAIRSCGKTFVNMNDCKLSIAQEKTIFETFGSVDALAAQYSGATFHPTCYDYSSEKKREISGTRRIAKFKRIKSSIDLLKAKVYFPSAGPACFLTEDLRHLNLNRETVFSSFNDLHRWLEGKTTARSVHLAPGDVFDLGILALNPVSDLAERYQTPEYIEHYAERHQDAVSEALAKYRAPQEDLPVIARAHFTEFLHLVPELALRANVVIDTQIVTDGGKPLSRFYVDTAMRRITDADPKRSLQYYTLRIPDIWMQALCDRAISWEDYILSFRLGISRDPDIYNEAFVAFLQLETAEERMDYLAYLRTQENRPPERITRVVNGIEIVHDRFCPHNGEDLSEADIVDGVLTCPRHFWRFDLTDCGNGMNNPCSLNVEVIGRSSYSSAYVISSESSE